MAKRLIPTNYKCSKCGVRGVRLWRKAGGFARLVCMTCADVYYGERYTPNELGNLGQWWVPAIPSHIKDCYKGVTAVTREDMAWWNELPLFQIKEDNQE